MSFRDDLATTIARDPRYTIEAYAFVINALNHARAHKLRARSRRVSKSEPGEGPSRRSRPKPSPGAEISGHVTGQELCRAARALALREFGLMSLTVLHAWGLRSTSDIGDIVYNLIRSGHLEKTPSDRREDFDGVFDFEAEFCPQPL
jgi:uncharacterized repeat protein (TIGR04138 family)